MDRALSLQGKLTQANCQEKQVPEPLPGVLCPKAQIRILTVGRSQPHLRAGPMRQRCIQCSKAKQGLGSTTMVSVTPISSSIIHRHSLGRSSFIPISKPKLLPTLLPSPGPGEDLRSAQAVPAYHFCPSQASGMTTSPGIRFII